MPLPCPNAKIVYKGKTYDSEEFRAHLKTLPVQEMAKYIASVKSIPSAPFEKTWHEMALRRIVKQAVDKGYDGVSWTGGEDQADRYSLAKQVNSIQYTDDGKLIAYGKDGDYKELGMVPEEKLADYIGKEAARKLLDQPKAKKHGEKGVYLGDRVLSGLDLKVGGEGMKGFYDKIVPDYLNKFGKKFGAKVSNVEFAVPDSKYSSTAFDWSADKARIIHRGDQYQVWAPNVNNGVDQHQGWFSSHEDAQRYIDDHKPYDQQNKSVQYLPITPEMRKSVSAEGVPLFNKEKSPDAGQDTTSVEPNNDLKEGAEKTPEPVAASTGTGSTTVIPVQGGTQVVASPIMIPAVPVPMKHVLPLHKLKEMAASMNPNHNPNPQIRSVQELMRLAQGRMIP